MAAHAPITGALTRAPLFAVPVLGSNRHLHLKAIPPRVTTRRELLCFAGAATALGAAVVTGAVAPAADVTTPSNVAPTPFSVAHSRYLAATARFNALPDDLEIIDEAAFDHETALHLDAYDALEDAPVADQHEFATAFIAFFEAGGSPRREAIDRMVATAKRLTGAA